MTVQKYDWVSKDTKLNANGWSVPLKEDFNVGKLAKKNLAAYTVQRWGKN